VSRSGVDGSPAVRASGPDPSTAPGQRHAYKAHLAVESESGLFTAVALRPGAGAAHHEAAIAPGLLAHEGGPLHVLVDAAYASAKLRAALTAAGHRQRIAAKRGPAFTVLGNPAARSRATGRACNT
jgi:hypothetical protein